MYKSYYEEQEAIKKQMVIGWACALLIGIVLVACAILGEVI